MRKKKRNERKKRNSYSLFLYPY
nr:photosystem I subunit I [Epimedium baojingense]